MSSPLLTTTAVTSPTLSVASWSQLDNIYQVNIAAAAQVIEEFLASPHNTWNYPSPRDSPRPACERYSVPPASPLIAVDRVDTLPNFLHVLADVAAQQDYILSPQLQYPPADKAQDTYVHLQFEEVVDRVPLADIPVENLPPAVVEAPSPLFPRLPRPLLSVKSSLSPLSPSTPNTSSSHTSGPPLPALLPTMSTLTNTLSSTNVVRRSGARRKNSSSATY